MWAIFHGVDLFFPDNVAEFPTTTSRHEQRSVGTFLSSPPAPPAATIIFSDLYCNGPARGQGYITYNIYISTFYIYDWYMIGISTGSC